MRLTRSRRLALLALLALLLTSCSWLPGATESTPTPSGTVSPVGPDVPEDLLPFYTQALTWESCGGGFECTQVDVPMDYDDPTGDVVTLEVKRLVASEGANRVGSLLVNPGGPGGSGVEFVESAQRMVSPEVREVYDLVGFDPRGVGGSMPIECVSDAELDELRAASYDTETQEGIDALRADMQRLATACEENTGRLLGYIDTVNATRDIDVLRAVLGDEQLYFLGYSYGTSLGATYAEMFSERVGRLVLDGGLDPALEYRELVYGQAEGFEAALRAYAEDCLTSQDCPLTTDVDTAVGQIQRLLELTFGSPLPTGTDRELTRSLAVSGIFLALYSDQYWPVLTDALRAAMRELDGSQLLFLADFAARREPDGTYSSNASVALTAVNCLDYPVDADPEDMAAEAARLRELAPTLGQFFSYGAVACDEWPVDATGVPAPVSAAGAEPILVVGTTGDPATPYEWSIALADQLESGRLLTFDGEGHTAYGRSNSCITDAVDRYLLRGDLPEEGLVC